ncbi:hypothetical protein GPECTOR_10g957 [Gonium pectorale]|uniref:DUF6816 domain-containing protein n=1 Tax=Gonium pectorale TaxID=33097 RepID=A0A150GR63_GONPE|nr:hypothetical protein GPECTOR_10g957 [Gonium pectorale]|eukprot:KXZ52325.1 hypothetical protein GPECTOR_10g957 [Gonium pectorale]
MICYSNPCGPAAAAAAPAATAPGSFLQPLLPSPSADLVAQLEGREPIYQPGVAWALRNRDRQLFYPAWLAGEWEVTARFAAASFPQGRRLLGRTVPGVLKGSMVVALPDVGAAMEAPLRYRARYVRSEEEGGVVADRVFNVQQLMDAFYGFEVTRRVEYEPLKNPTRLTVVYATPRQDKSVISEDLRKAELIINNRLTQELSPTDFICGELFRQISQASAQGYVHDYETITRFTLVPPTEPTTAPASPGPVSEIDAPTATAAAAPAESSSATTSTAAPGTPGGGGASYGVGSRVHVLQRVAGFLQPQDAAFFEAGNQAVAAYDYVYDLVRVA